MRAPDPESFVLIPYGSRSTLIDLYIVSFLAHVVVLDILEFYVLVLDTNTTKLD